MRIKALSLRTAGRIDDAIELLHRSMDQQSSFSETATAREILGDISVDRGKRQEAIDYYREILTQHPSLNGTTGATEISLAEVLLDDCNANDVAEALTLLESWMRRHQLKLNSTLFRWHLARIRVAEHVGDRDTVRSSAATALELAGKGPQLPRHKDVGLVETDEVTLRRLKRLST